MSTPVPLDRACVHGMASALPPREASSISASIASVISGEALPAYSGLNLNPFHCGGLWLAVMMTAPPARRSMTL